MTYRNHASQDDLDDPLWGQTDRIHDWRNYIGEKTRTIWGTFTSEQRMALAADADERACYEHWD